MFLYVFCYIVCWFCDDGHKLILTVLDLTAMCECEASPWYRLHTSAVDGGRTASHSMLDALPSPIYPYYFALFSQTPTEKGGSRTRLRAFTWKQNSFHGRITMQKPHKSRSEFQWINKEKSINHRPSIVVAARRPSALPRPCRRVPEGTERTITPLGWSLFYDAHMWSGTDSVILWLDGKHEAITQKLPCLFLWF